MKHPLLKEVHQLFLGENIQSTDLHQLVLVVINQLFEKDSKHIYTPEGRFEIIKQVIPQNITYADFAELILKCANGRIPDTEPIVLTKEDLAYFNSPEYIYVE